MLSLARLSPPCVLTYTCDTRAPGAKAVYNFSATYRVAVDDYFLRFLATECVVVDIIQVPRRHARWRCCHAVAPRSFTGGAAPGACVCVCVQTQHASHSPLARAVVPLRRLLGVHGRLRSEHTPLRSRSVAAWQLSAMRVSPFITAVVVSWSPEMARRWARSGWRFVSLCRCPNCGMFSCKTIQRKRSALATTLLRRLAARADARPAGVARRFAWMRWPSRTPT